MAVLTFSGSTTWVCPDGVTSVDVECWGGGGAGGGATARNSTAGGGAGGNYVKKTVAVSYPNEYTVTIGAGGVGDTTSDPGPSGEASWFSTVSEVYATGGPGAALNASNNTNGAGATADTTGCIGDTINSGGSGGTGAYNNISGAGGGGAGSGGAGGDGNVGVGGTGTADYGGDGADGVGINTAGGNGLIYGGGGSGGHSYGSNTDRAGGDGAQGLVRLTYTEPSPTPSISVSTSILVTPSQTPTRTPSTSFSQTPTRTPSTSFSQTPTQTTSASFSQTPTRTPSTSFSQTPSITPSISFSQTTTITPSVSLSQTPSITPTITQSQWCSSTMSDDFESYNTGLALGGQGNWISIGTGIGPYVVTGKYVAGPASASNEGGAYRLDSVSNDQFAQCSLVAIGTDEIGVAIRCSGSGASSYYFGYYGGSASRHVFMVHAGTFEDIMNTTGSTVFSTGAVIRLEVRGTTLRAYYNGSIDTSLAGGGEIDITSILGTYGTLASGYVGIASYPTTVTQNSTIDNWSGGCLAAASPSVTPSITPSTSFSQTPTQTPSTSFSQTPTQTASTSFSQTPTRTPSTSFSQTPSITPSISTSRPVGSPSTTPSITVSTSFSQTPTQTASTSFSQTPTQTASTSFSQTPTITPSTSFSQTPSQTTSTSFSQTPSITPSISTSRPAGSPSTTPSITISASFSQTPTITSSTSFSQTPSITPSTSFSQTPSITPSTSFSQTPSITPSISLSRTPSITPSTSFSQTPSQTPSISLSRTPSQTPSISFSRTPSITPSISISTSFSPSRTPSITPTESQGTIHSHFVAKYSTTDIPNTVRIGNIAFGSNGIQDWGETAVTGFWNGSDPPTNGYVILTLTASRTEPSIVVARNDNDVIYWARSYGGTNINTIGDAINYLLTGSTNTTILNTYIPQIVTSGLTVYYDAGILPSYPRTGIVWNDLSGNNYNGTLKNGITYDSSANGCLVLYSGLTSYISTIYSGSSNYFTFEYAVKDIATNPATSMLHVGRYNGSGNDYWSGINSVTNTIIFSTNGGLLDSNVAPDTSSFHIITCVFGPSAQEIYIDGQIKNSKGPTTCTPGGTIGIGTFGETIGYHPSCYFSSFRFYERNLSSDEVLQNFNAVRSRFGL